MLGDPLRGMYADVSFTPFSLPQIYNGEGKRQERKSKGDTIIQANIV